MRAWRALSGRSVCFVVALAALLATVPLTAAAQLGSSNRSSSSRSSDSDLGSNNSSSSSRSNRSSSSRRSSSDRDSDVGDDDSDSGSRSRSSSSRRAGSSRSSGGGSKGFTAGGSSSDEPPPIVFGPKYEREGVRPRGNLISAAVFQQLPCTPTPVTAGASVHYLCGDNWYQRIDHEGWTCYAEIYPPAGARVSSLPAGAEPLFSEGRLLYVTADAFYTPTADGTAYEVVEPSVGLRLERLPDGTGQSVPVVVNGVEYYRHLGVFYREENGPLGTSYVVSKSPYAVEPLPIETAQAKPVPVVPTDPEWEALHRTGWQDFPPPVASPRDAFIGPAVPPRTPPAVDDGGAPPSSAMPIY